MKALGQQMPIRDGNGDLRLDIFGSIIR